MAYGKGTALPFVFASLVQAASGVPASACRWRPLASLSARRARADTICRLLAATRRPQGSPTSMMIGPIA